MTEHHIEIEDLSFATNGMSPEELELYLDPATDPASILPACATDAACYVHDAPALPSVEEIEAALNDHVRNNVSAHDLIASLLQPFANSCHLTLEPGNGAKRPSYAVSIPQLRFKIARASTRSVAEDLHEIAASLARFAVGNRAPDDAPYFRCSLPRGGSIRNDIDIKAPSLATARGAYNVITGTLPDSIEVPLSLGASDILPHVLAARDLIAQHTLGEQDIRRRALDLITAMQDLRAVSTVILRRNPAIRSNDMIFIEIEPLADNPVTVSDYDTPDRTAHQQIAFVDTHKELIASLKKVIDRHPILRHAPFPGNCTIELSGDPNVSLPRIVDNTKGIYSSERETSLRDLEYANINDLAKRLHASGSQASRPSSHWRIDFDSQTRTQRSWDIRGETLAHAIAGEIDPADPSASSKLFDLAIDLMADQQGKKVDLRVTRVL